MTPTYVEIKLSRPIVETLLGMAHELIADYVEQCDGDDPQSMPSEIDRRERLTQYRDACAVREFADRVLALEPVLVSLERDYDGER